MKSYLEVLEYGKLKSIISKYIQTPYGKNEIDSLKPVFDIEKAKKDFERLNEFFTFFYKWGSFALDDIFISDIIKDSFSGTLIGKELIKIGNFLIMLKDIEEWFEKFDSNLCTYYISFNIPDELIDEIKNAIDEHGFIKDSATGYLYELREQIKQTKSEIMRSLKNTMHTRAREVISDTAIFMKRSRYTLLMKPNFKEYINGRIIDMSKSGGFFVEPDNVYGKNNDLEELLLKEEAEVRKILVKITNLVRKYSSQLIYNEKRLGFFDLEVAKFEYAKDFEQPEIIFSDKPILFAKNVKHPILAHIKKDTKSVDIDLKSDNKLIITGPNTGGKTVFLKTIGLVSASIFSNIPPIGSYIEIGNFDSIFAVIGDEQDIIESLSSFSAKLLSFKTVYNSITKNSLVLLDEIGSGTSPEEGEAVAYSIIKNLSDKCVFAATTHYKRLAYIISSQNYPVAAFNFDEKTLKPTYKLVYSQVGKSYATEILKTLGIPKEIIDTAVEFYKNNETNFSKLEKELENKLYNLNREKKETEKLRIRYNELMEQEQQQIKAIKNSLSLEAENKKRMYKELIEKLEVQIGILLKEKNVSKAHKTLSRIKQDAKELFSLNEEYQSKGSFNVGEEVDFNNSTGRIVGIKGKKATIEIEGKAIEVPIGLLKKTDKKTIQKTAITKSVNTFGRLEVNLIGKRRDDAEIELMRFLDSLITSRIKTVRIIHGIGSGILREMVRDTLKNHPYIKSFHTAHPNEGGDGATIAEFK